MYTTKFVSLEPNLTFAQVISAWRLSQSQIGSRVPREGYARQNFCPPCYRILEEMTPLTAQHVWGECETVRHQRIQLGIAEFVENYMSRGNSFDDTFGAYLHGVDNMDNAIEQDELMARGEALKRIQDDWLELW